MNDWWGITKKNQLRDYQKKTSQFIEDLEATLNNFENTADIRELSSKIKESIKKFQEESKD